MLKQAKLPLSAALLIVLMYIPGFSMAQQIRIVTEHLPPYQFLGSDNHLTGLGVEIVELLLATVDEQADIELMPWARAYDLALTEKNVMIFSILRSPERQEQFKWVGDFIKQNYYFLGLKSRSDISVGNIQDVKRYITGVSRNSFEHQLLKRYGFSNHKNLHVNVAQLPLIEMLFDGKIDMVFGSKITLLGLIDYVDKDTSAIRLLYQINENPGTVAIAFSKQTDDKVVAKYRAAFAKLNNSGRLNVIIAKWVTFRQARAEI